MTLVVVEGDNQAVGCDLVDGEALP